MSSQADSIFGQDIKLDDGGQALVAANGELVMTQGVETGSQDIRVRLFTPLGTLFYDQDFGSLVHEWVKEENTLAARMAFCAEVARRVRLDQRVQYGSEACSILSWDETGIKAAVSWQFIDEDSVFNLVIETNEDMELVIKDVNPGQ